MSRPPDERIEIHAGDITGLEVDAIVNAANDQLARGGGVCGAIHRAAGPGLAEACRVIGGCPTGTSCWTDGFDLKAKHVIHTVGPVWHGGQQNEPGLLASCYRTSLKIAQEIGASSLAFPAISTGVYRFPLDLASEIAIATVREYLSEAENIDRVLFCVFGAAAEASYRKKLGS